MTINAPKNLLTLLKADLTNSDLFVKGDSFVSLNKNSFGYRLVKWVCETFFGYDSNILRIQEVIKNHLLPECTIGRTDGSMYNWLCFSLRNLNNSKSYQGLFSQTIEDLTLSSAAGRSRSNSITSESPTSETSWDNESNIENTQRWLSD